MADITLVQARTVLARAFADDPLMVWFFPDEDARPHACAALLGSFAEHYLAVGQVDVAGAPDPRAVALWRWPAAQDGADTARGDTEAGSEELPSIGGLMTALMGIGRVQEVGAAMAALTALRPPEPHVYLHFLAVHPGAWHRGLGGELLDRGLAAARAAGLAVCLETMNPANVPFYEAHGLSVRHELQLAPNGPTTWSMANS